MAVVREKMLRRTGVNVWVTYDNEIMVASFTKDGYLKIEFIGGYYVIPTNTGIEITRTGRDKYLVGDINNNVNTINHSITDDKLVGFQINLGVSNNDEMVITSTNTQYAEVIHGATIIFNGEGFTAKMIANSNGQEFDVPINEIWDNPIQSYYTAELIALDGYIITEAKHYNSSWDEWSYFSIDPDSKSAVEYGLALFKKQQYVIEVTTELIDDPDPDPEPEPDYESGFNNLYLTDYNVLNSISKEDLEVSWGSSTAPIRVDLRTFIINVLEIPFVVPDEYVKEKRAIKLGNYSLSTVAPSIQVNKLFLNLGTISVPHKFNNSYDYMNTITKLHLPYIPSIDLEVEYVIGYEINIEYILDLFSGDVTVNIKSSKTGKNIFSKNYKIGRQIPFISSSDKVVNSNSDMNGLDNQIRTAYIEVVRNVPNSLNTFSNRVVIEKVLDNENGFITVNEINLKTRATLQEKNDIIRLLKNGVFIK